MRVIPVLDIRGGLVVHAVRGERRQYQPLRSTWCPDAGPSHLAAAFRERLGIRELYIADLDAIEGGVGNLSLVTQIAAAGSLVWLDAGVRFADDLPRLIEAGLDRIVVGLETVAGRRALESIAASAYRQCCLISLDLRDGEPVGEWGPTVGSSCELASLVAQLGFGSILALDVGRVGTDEGLASWAVPLIARLRERIVDIDWYAGGGCGGREDLDRLEAAGFAGALVGSCWHNGNLGPEDARRWL